MNEHQPCCDACNGQGGTQDGPCSDCLGTGCAHPKMTRVKATSEMDVETFRKHMNARHAPLGGLTVIGKSNIPGDENEDILRHYHDKAHELGLDSIGGGRTREINHYHSKTKETK